MTSGEWPAAGRAQWFPVGAVVDLLSMPLSATEDEVLAAVTAAAIQLTGSPVGFCHLVDDEHRKVEVGACATLAGPAPVGDDQWVPIPQRAWGTPVHRATTVVADKPRWVGGLPGFADPVGPVRRYLGVPVLAPGGGLLLGLANARSPYRTAEVHAAEQVARAGWAVLDRGRQHRAAVEDLALLTELVGTRAGTWRWDPQSTRVRWSPDALQLLGAGTSADHAGAWAVLEDSLEPFSRYRLRQAREDLEPGHPLELELWARGAAGEQVSLLLRGRWSGRLRGGGREMEGILADVTAQEQDRRARERATRDQLTGLTNRAGLIAELNRRISPHAGRSTDPLAVHMLDLDRFKQVNDTHGHLAGDALLRATATRLQQAVRSGDLVARLGGDEFVIVQHPCPGPDQARVLANRLLTALAQPVEVAGVTLSVGASIGVAFPDPERPGIKGLLARADAALYAAKKAGGMRMSLPPPDAP